MNKVREAIDKVRNGKGKGSTESIRTFFEECGAVLREGWYIGDSHEGHERRAEEGCVNEGLDVELDCVQA